MGEIKNIGVVIHSMERIAKEYGLNIERVYHSNLVDPYSCLINPSTARIDFYFKHPKYGSELVFPYKSYDDIPKEFISRVEESIRKKWFANKDRSYRDKLVQQIKDAGQDLIDRAESFVAEDLEMIAEFSIIIDFQRDCATEIKTTMTTTSKTEYIRIMNE